MMEKPIIIVIKPEELQRLHSILTVVLKILVIITVLIYGPGILGLLDVILR